ncbi:hypothetical protein G6F31_017012 [Rhizopus arrhizus]|nr:hypothetical protein G6F31_017012 [Rhizopus arrhizus]
MRAAAARGRRGRGSGAVGAGHLGGQLARDRHGGLRQPYRGARLGGFRAAPSCVAGQLPGQFRARRPDRRPAGSGDPRGDAGGFQLSRHADRPIQTSACGQPGVAGGAWRAAHAGGPGCDALAGQPAGTQRPLARDRWQRARARAAGRARGPCRHGVGVAGVCRSRLRGGRVAGLAAGRTAGAGRVAAGAADDFAAAATGVCRLPWHPPRQREGPTLHRFPASAG